MTPTEIEATWPPQVIEAIHWIKTHCRHWAILGSHDWQTFDELTPKELELATEHLLVLLIMGLVGVASTVPKKKPGRCGIPNFYIKPLVSYQEHLTNREHNMNDQQIESEIQAKGMTAPRVTPADIEANIIGEQYFTAYEGILGNETMHPTGSCLSANPLSSPYGLLTLCVLVLKNGFTVTGESACASPENFDAEMGRKIARQNAVNKIWPLLGFALKQRLHEGSEG